MSGNLNNGYELFPFHLVGKFSRTEAKYLLTLLLFDRHLEGLATKLTSLRPPIFFCSVTCLVILELHKYSNNLPITVSAAPTEVQRIQQEEFLFMDSL